MKENNCTCTMGADLNCPVHGIKTDRERLIELHKQIHGGDINNKSDISIMVDILEILVERSEEIDQTFSI